MNKLYYLSALILTLLAIPLVSYAHCAGKHSGNHPHCGGEEPPPPPPESCANAAGSFPSFAYTKQLNVPLNEYTSMKLAAMVGVEIPEIKLVKLSNLDNLPPINLPEEQYAFAIKRFDRDGNTRIHMEDFAQVLVKYPDQKYDSASYEHIGKVLYDFSGDGLADAQQFVRRLLVNILLANGDAHLKNWSLRYEDQITPRLSPAYDILTTFVYMEGETDFALNLDRNKNWYATSLGHFERWAGKAGVPWRAIKPHLIETLEMARSLWSESLKDLPMQENHKEKLHAHWKNLHKDFVI